MEAIPKCTNCGAEVTILSTEEELTTCQYCGSSVLVLQAKKLSFFDEFKLNLLKNNRELLEQSLPVNDIEGIIQASSEILKLIPDDFSATYFQRFTKAQRGDDRLLNEFYQSSNDFPSTEEERLAVIQHVLEYGSLSNQRLIKAFIEENAGEQANYYTGLLEQHVLDRIRQEELYDDIPRDVFISYRTTDQETADQVVKLLEQDGLVCWISSRNLRPNDNLNYWHSIERAIERSKLFLVISSQEAMLSRDVKREITTAQNLNKQRIEIKIDLAPPTTFFKVFFEGVKWLDASNGFGVDHYQSLLSRVHELISGSNSQMDPLSSTLSTIDNFIASGDFTQASSLVESVINLEQPDFRLLWRQLLIDFESKSHEQLLGHEGVFNSNTYKWIQHDSSEKNQQQIKLFEEQYTERFIQIDRGVVTGLKQSNIQVVRLPDYIEEIANEVFANQSTLTRIHLNKVKVLHNNAFNSCEELEEVNIGQDCIEIGDQAFANCSKINSIELPDTINTMGEEVFIDCEHLSSIKLSRRLKKLPNRMLSGTSLTSIDLPEGLLEIGDEVFEETPIALVTIPATLKRLNTKSFVNMYALSEIQSLSNEFPSINGVLFSKDQTTLICYPPNKKGFKYEISAGVTRLQDYSFYMVGHLIEVIFPNTLEEIGTSAFQMAQQIDRFILPDSVKVLETECFSSIRHLKEIRLGKNLTLLKGHGHFSHNPKLTTIQIPSQIASIPNHCFNQSSSLERIELPDGLNEIGEYSFAGTIIKNLDLPKSVKSIPSRAFLSCRNLRTINLSSVKTIGDAAFKENVSLGNVLISSHLISIGKEAFANCQSLQQVQGLNSNMVIAMDAFQGTGVLL